jgi:hypothetical protein
LDWGTVPEARIRLGCAERTHCMGGVAPGDRTFGAVCGAVERGIMASG